MMPITPHPLATWVQMQVSPQRRQAVRRRRRKVARILHARNLARQAAGYEQYEQTPQPEPGVPAAPPAPVTTPDTLQVTPAVPRQRTADDAPVRIQRASRARV